MRNQYTFVASLLASTILSATAFAGDNDESCAPIGGLVPPTCDALNRTTAVRMVAEPNQEFDNQQGQITGLSVSVNGVPVSGDGQVRDLARRVDMALERADVRVSFDGLEVQPRLDLEVVGPDRAFAPGDTVTLQSAANYPAFIARAEMRIIDLRAPGGPRVVAVAPVAVNGQVALRLPEGRDLVAVHRVYDREGRYDETVPLALSQADQRELVDGVEDGHDATARRRIPLSGGSVTVSGNAGRGATHVHTLGEDVPVDPAGRFVLQRVLPVGEHDVEVDIHSGNSPIRVTRQIEIPQAEWFHFATGDVTARWGDNGASQSGRFGFYVNGRTANGTHVTAAADTGEGDLSTLFSDLDARNPRTLVKRIDPETFYPVYGDDSTFEETAPTSGKLYFRAEKDGNHILWGNFAARVDGGQYLRSERILYGAQANWATQDQSADGAPIASFDAYAASPDNLPQRDVFTGTGGSVYFLQQPDIAIGSESLSVEIRDAVTGRVISSQPLVYGRDYDVNYFQGVVTLTQPLSGFAPTGVVTGSGQQVNLVAQYEYTPSGFAVTGQSYGARAEIQAAPGIRVGVTAQVEGTATADQRAAGIDLDWQIGENSFVKAEVARSDGPGFGSSYSSNGGLTITNGSVTSGSGVAAKIDAQADLGDLGFNQEGHIGAYAEYREAGFSSIDYQVSDTERLFGLYGQVEINDRLAFNSSFDAYLTDSGTRSVEAVAEFAYTTANGRDWDIGVTHIDRANATETGTRTELGLRAEIFADDALYAFGRVTLQETGLGRNDRIGLGGTQDLGNDWNIEAELSTGTSGWGGRALASRETDQGGSLYFGYELDPDRVGLGQPSNTQNNGVFVLGGRRQISSSVTSWGENTYDLFGQRKSLTSSYGVEYRASDALRFSAGLEMGDVVDPVGGNYRRTGLTLGVTHNDGDLWSTKGRFALRRDDNGAAGRADVAALGITSRYAPNDYERYSFALEGVSANSSLGSVPDGELVDLSLGYALRPVSNDRFNMLFKYRYLYDMFGQDVDGTTTAGPRQRSHVWSADAEYDVNRNWTIGTKLGLRLSETSAAPGSAFVANDAWLAVANARYHIVHKWDGLLEARMLGLTQAQSTETGLLGAVYRHVGNNSKIGLGYNFGRFSDDLTDLVADDRGMFLNVVAKF